MTGTIGPAMHHESTPPAMVLVLHGLGMCPKDFSQTICDYLAAHMPEMPAIQLSVPEAPTKPVTYLDGQPKLRRWFDIERAPVLPFEVHEDLWDSVAFVQELLRKAESAGIPSSCIVLAGFSQGAVLALSAGLTYEHQLAGICAFSGWLPAGVLETVRQQQTPIFMSHGDKDTLIPANTGLKSAWALKESGCSRVQFQRHAEFGHSFGNDEQMEEFEAFVRSNLFSKKGLLFSDTLSTNEGSDGSRSQSASFDESGSSDEESPSMDSVNLMHCCPPVTRPKVQIPCEVVVVAPQGHSNSSARVCGERESGWHVNQEVQVLRTSGSWSSGTITEIEQDMVTVILDDGNRKRIPKSAMAIQVRLPRSSERPQKQTSQSPTPASPLPAYSYPAPLSLVPPSPGQPNRRYALGPQR